MKEPDCYIKAWICDFEGMDQDVLIPCEAGVVERRGSVMVAQVRPLGREQWITWLASETIDPDAVQEELRP